MMASTDKGTDAFKKVSDIFTFTGNNFFNPLSQKTDIWNKN